MGKFQIYQDGRAAGANPISGSDFVTKDYLENHSVELDPVYKADSSSLKASASLASASSAWITLNSGSLAVSMSYDSDQKKIKLFSSGSTVVAEIDATAFIKDGMVNTITLDTGSLDLTITFNTDAGKEDIVVPMRNVFDLTMFYTKDETYSRDEIATLSQPFVSASNWVAENSASLMSGSVVVLSVDNSTYDETTETWQVGSEFVSRVTTLLGEGKTIILKISTVDGVIYPRFITTIAGVAHVFGGFVSPDLGSAEGEPFTNHTWLLQLGTGTLAYIAHRIGGYHPDPLTWVEDYSGSLSELSGWFSQSGSSAAQVVSWVTNNSASIVTGSIENVPDVVILPVDNSTWDGESNTWNVGTEFVSEVSAAVADNKAVYLAVSDTETTLYPPLVAAAPGYMYGFGGLTMPGSNYSEHRTWILMSNGYLQQNITQGQNYIEGLEQWVTNYSASLIEAEHWIVDSGSLTVTASTWVTEKSNSVESTVDWVTANSASISASAISSSLWKKGGRNSAGSPVASIVAGWTTPDNALETGIYTINAGWGSHTSGNYAVAFNAFTSASGQYSFAEGFANKARGDKSHAEGDQTTAHAAGSHTEGGATVASGGYSHAEGWRTNTTNPYEHAQGKFNATHSKQIFSVGVGHGDPGLVGEYYGKNAISVITGSAPSASIYILGVGSYDGTNPEPGVNDVATVISNISPGESDPFFAAKSASLEASASVATEASRSVHAISTKTGSWDAKENVDNKVTEISSTSTNTEYPSAKAVQDRITGLSGTATIASSTDGVVVIKRGILQTAGVVGNNTDADITLHKIATSGNPSDIVVVYDGTTTNLQAVLNQIKTDIDSAAASGTEYIVCDNVASEIPEGFQYYNGVTGTLAASAQTAGKIYLVKNGTASYNQVTTTLKNGVYSWTNLGSTVVDLSGVIKTITVNGKTYGASGGSMIDIGDVITGVTAQAEINNSNKTLVHVVATTGEADSTTGTKAVALEAQAKIATVASGESGLVVASDVKDYVDNRVVFRTWTAS